MKEETTPTIDDEQKMNEIIYGYRCFSVPSERGHEEAWPIEAIQKMMTEWASLHQCGGWVSEKPEFKSECVFITATKYERNDEPIYYEYTAWQIKQIDGEDDDGNPAWYWGLLNGDGEEYGALEDLEVDFYLIIPSPNESPSCKVDELRSEIERLQDIEIELEKKTKSSKEWCDKAMEAARYNQQQSKRISELEEGLRQIIKSFDKNCPQEPTQHFNVDPPFEWWSPAGVIVESKPISNAKQLLK